MIVLVVIGVAAAFARAAFPDHLTARIDPERSRILAWFGITDPFAADRPAELLRIDERFAVHRRFTLLHVLPGGLLLLFAPLQFSARIRNGFRPLHRWSGRVLICAGVVAAVPAFYFGVLIPYAGPAEAVAIGLTTGFFVLALAIAFVAIRRRQVSRHREWMIRAFAAALAISTVRIVAVVLDPVLTPAGLRPPVIFVIAIWTGWIVTLGGAEMWIRYTRPALSSRSGARIADFP